VIEISVMNGIYKIEHYTNIVINIYMYTHTHIRLGTSWLSWLRNCATKHKVAVSIFDSVTGNFH